jgi:hypothetical protein
VYMVLLVVGSDHMLWCAYVGATKSPRSRINQHRSKPLASVKKVLDRLGKGVSDLLFIPLEVVSDDLGHVAEVDLCYRESRSKEDEHFCHLWQASKI